MIFVVSVTAFVDILHAPLIAPLEGLAILMALAMRHIRMTVLLAIVHVGLAMVLEILPRAVDAVVIAAPGYVAPIVIWNPRPRLVVVSRGRRSLLGLRSGDAKCGHSQTDK